MGLDSVFAADLPVSFGQMQLVQVLDEAPGRRLFLAETPGQGGLPAQVAVLVLRPPSQRSAAPSMTELLADLQRARSLRHAAIAQTFACGVEDDLIFVVSELCPGPTLAQLVAESGAVPLQSAVAIVAQAGLALAGVHELSSGERSSPLLHRHLGPELVTVAASGLVKVSGFGLAHLMDAYSPAAARPTSALSFASPEVLAGQAVSACSDVFSLGALLAYSTLGVLPFDVPSGAQKAQYLSAIVRALADGGLSKRMDALAPGLGPLTQRMVALDPGARPASVRQVVEELRGLIEDGSAAAEDTDAAAGEDDLDAESTLGHGGPPAVTEASLAVDGGGAPRPPAPEVAPQHPQAAVPPAVPSRGPLTLSAPIPVWANAVEPDTVPTDEAPQPVGTGLEPSSAEQAPTDRMSSLFYRQQGGADASAVRATAVQPIGPPAAGQSVAHPQQPAAPGPSPGRPVRRRSQSNMVPILALLVFVVFAVLSVLGALVFVKMNLGDVAAPGTGGADVVEDSSGLEPGGEMGPTGALEPPDAAAEADPTGEPGAAVEGAAEAGAEAGEGAAGEGQIDAGDEPPEPAVQASQPRSTPPRRAAVATGTAAELAISHRPRRSGDTGASDLISVKVTGPADTRVQVYSGPEGGPFKSSTLRRRGTGRWEGWLTFGVGSGEVLEYWVVATHPDAESPVTSGSGSEPHRVQVR